jgi:hypothetical protein
MAMNGDARIEALEHQLMRAWASADGKVMRTLLAKRFRLVLGGDTPVLLDRKSLLEAAGKDWRLERYRFGQRIYAREVDGIGIFAAELELDGIVAGHEVSGRWWQADIWQRSRLPRRWRLLDRQLARLESDRHFAEAVRSLQLWR